MAIHYLSRSQALLDQRFPLALDEPFTWASASRAGIKSSELSLLVRRGLVRRLIEGVYVVAQVPDSLALRIDALRLVVPPGVVVTDRTAAWLHGAETALAPGDHVAVPKVSAFHRSRGGRLRNELTASGQRMMPDDHVTDVGGLLVTTPVRTACDLGRLLGRDRAFAALDALLRLGMFEKDELLEATTLFRGYRGVRQLRWMAPLADGRAESPQESILRLRWLDCSHLPPPEPQRPVRAPSWVAGGYYWLDLGVDDLRFAVEYDGEAHHGPGQKQHDADRRAWIRDHGGWIVRVVRAPNIHGRTRDVEAILRRGVEEARATLHGRRTHI